MMVFGFIVSLASWFVVDGKQFGVGLFGGGAGFDHAGGEAAGDF